MWSTEVVSVVFQVWDVIYISSLNFEEIVANELPAVFS